MTDELTPAQLNSFEEASRVLQERGILAAARFAGWFEQPHRIGDTEYMGWAIPIWDREGKEQVAFRWKNALRHPPDGTKSRWKPKKPILDYEIYYLLPGTQKAIAERNGLAFWASGEPDTLTFIAAGAQNVLCWFDGEGHLPATFAADMQAFGITRIVHFPDRDSAGIAQAMKMRDACAAAGIEYSAYELPGEIGSKHDVNWLWIELDFDRDRFWNEARELPLLEVPPTPPPDLPPRPEGRERPASTQQQGDIDWEKVYADYVTELKTNSRLQPTKREGGVGRFQCVNPTHPDNHPSARISYDKDPYLGIYVCTCGSSRGDGISWTEVGEWLGERWEDYKKEWLKTNRPNTRSNGSQPPLGGPPPEYTSDTGNIPNPFEGRELSTEQYILPELLQFGYEWDAIPLERVLFTSQDAARLYADRVRGFHITSRRFPFPFTAFHHLGGLYEIGSPGDIYGWLGLSGYGKTSFIDSITDAVRQNGEHVLAISPEIAWWKTADRFAQRWAKVDVTQSLKNDLYYYEVSQYGESHFGQKMSETSAAEAIDLVNWQADNWPGRLYMIDQFGANAMWLLTATYKAVMTLRKLMNIHIDRITLDYIQLMFAPQEWRGNLTYEQILRLFKALCGTVDAVGDVVSQVRKSDTSAVMSKTKKTMDQDSGMHLRDFQFKGYATMVPGLKKKRGGEMEVLDYAIFNVTKNSEGRKGRVELEAEWARMRFLDHPKGLQRANKRQVQGDTEAEEEAQREFDIEF